MSKWHRDVPFCPMAHILRYRAVRAIVPLHIILLDDQHVSFGGKLRLEKNALILRRIAFVCWILLYSMVDALWLLLHATSSVQGKMYVFCRARDASCCRLDTIISNNYIKNAAIVGNEHIHNLACHIRDFWTDTLVTQERYKFSRSQN